MTRISILLFTLAGFLAGWYLPHTHPDTTLPPPVPTPHVQNTCTEWWVTENAPDYYWTPNSTSGADYWTTTILQNGTTTTIKATRGEWVQTPPSDNQYLTITYWDDRPEPQPLATHTFKVPTCG